MVPLCVVLDANSGPSGHPSDSSPNDASCVAVAGKVIPPSAGPRKPRTVSRKYWPGKAPARTTAPTEVQKRKAKKPETARNASWKTRLDTIAVIGLLWRRHAEVKMGVQPQSVDLYRIY